MKGKVQVPGDKEVDAFPRSDYTSKMPSRDIRQRRSDREGSLTTGRDHDLPAKVSLSSRLLSRSLELESLVKDASFDPLCNESFKDK